MLFNVVCYGLDFGLLIVFCGGVATVDYFACVQ